MSRSFLLFASVRYAIKAESYCREQGVECRVLPVPRQISSECGMCLEVENAQAELLLSHFQETGFPVSLASVDV